MDKQPQEYQEQRDKRSSDERLVGGLTMREVILELSKIVGLEKIKVAETEACKYETAHKGYQTCYLAGMGTAVLYHPVELYGEWPYTLLYYMYR